MNFRHIEACDKLPVPLEENGAERRRRVIIQSCHLEGSHIKNSKGRANRKGVYLDRNIIKCVLFQLINVYEKSCHTKSYRQHCHLMMQRFFQLNKPPVSICASSTWTPFSPPRWRDRQKHSSTHTLKDLTVYPIARSPYFQNTTIYSAHSRRCCRHRSIMHKEAEPEAIASREDFRSKARGVWSSKQRRSQGRHSFSDISSN